MAIKDDYIYVGIDNGNIEIFELEKSYRKI